LPLSALTGSVAGRAYPAALTGLCHERRVLRSGDPAGLKQEIWAPLALYQALRTAITVETATVPGTDRIAVEPAQTLVTSARNITATSDLAGDIGRRPGQPAPATPTPRLCPPGQIPAQPLEQAPARQTPHLPADHQDQHRTASRDTRQQSVTTASGP
jgi:hypothetical protein